MTTSAPVTKRAFLKLGLLMNGMIGAALAIPVLRYVLSPAIRRPAGADAWISLGALERFPIGETRLGSFAVPDTSAADGATGNAACWVRRTGEHAFQVFAINCAHLGCPVRWFPQSNLFLCPCHGGAYYADGSRASGPPERGLFEYRYRIDGGKLLIQASEMPTPGLVARADGKRRLPCV